MLSASIFIYLPQTVSYTHLLHASEADCKEPNIEQEPELEKPQFNVLVAECKEILAGVGKILENMTAKGVDPEPPTLVETEVIENLEPELEVEESGSEVVIELAPL